MKVNLKVIGFVSALSLYAGYEANKCISVINEADNSIKKMVKMQNPNRYNQIINSGHANDIKVWQAAMREINDTLRNLNSDAQKGYFRANMLLKDTTKQALKSIK